MSQKLEILYLINNPLIDFLFRMFHVKHQKSKFKMNDYSNDILLHHQSSVNLYYLLLNHFYMSSCNILNLDIINYSNIRII